MPKKRIIRTEKFLRSSGERPVALTIADKKSVKRVKLRTKPITMPIGLRCPPFKEPERTMGRIGKIQGESMVTKPAMNENKIKRSIN